MTRLFSLLAIAAFLAILPVKTVAEGFLSAASDIPLIDGLVELDDGVLVFDKPQGRIVQLTAVRDAGLTSAQVANFYRNSLPNLGWTPVDETETMLTFTGQGEILRLTLTADLVIFDVTPQGAP